MKDFLRSARASLRELLIVVFGILIAFSLEAWWNQHANRQREAAELRGLETDLAETRETLNRMIKYENELVASYDTLLTLLESARPAARTSVSRKLARDLFSTGTYDPPMGRVESLIASGNIGLVRNDSLRERIAGWPAVVSEAREHQTRTRDFWMDDFAPSLRLLMDMSPLWRSARDTTISAIDLPTSPGVTNLIYQLRFHARIVVAAQRVLLDDAIKLHTLVQAEIDR